MVALPFKEIFESDLHTVAGGIHLGRVLKKGVKLAINFAVHAC